MNSIDETQHIESFLANLPRLKPTRPSNPVDHPSYLFYSTVKDITSSSTLGLRSKAFLPGFSTQLARVLPCRPAPSTPLPPAWRKMVGLGGFEPPTSRLSGVRSNQTEL